MTDLQFLKSAHEYAETRNESLWFIDTYSQFREFMGIRASANQALFSLYGTDCHLVEGYE